jgi:hypothetical protein
MTRSKTTPRPSTRKRMAKSSLIGQAGAVAGAPLVQTPRKVMVIIHGAGDFPDDYYKPFVAAIEQRLGGPFNYIPVYYADITNPPASAGITALTAPVDSPAKAKFEQDLMAEMQRTADARPPARSAVGITATDDAFGSGNVSGISLLQIIVKEVGEYLFTANVAAQIQQRLVAGLDQAAQQFDQIVLACLSLGTVVAFDVLKQFANRYTITYFFTAGCPLAKLRHVGVRSPDLGAITPADVAHWYNLYDTNDIVADAIGPQLPDYRLHDIYVHVGDDPISAHDYFNNGETLDLLADAMR